MPDTPLTDAERLLANPLPDTWKLDQTTWADICADYRMSLEDVLAYARGLEQRVAQLEQELETYKDNEWRALRNHP